jgi:hypothetical protein
LHPWNVSLKVWLLVEDWTDAEVDTLAAALKRLSARVRILATKSSGSHKNRLSLLKSMVQFKEKPEKTSRIEVIFSCSWV